MSVWWIAITCELVTFVVGGVIFVGWARRSRSPRMVRWMTLVPEGVFGSLPLFLGWWVVAVDYVIAQVLWPER